VAASRNWQGSVAWTRRQFAIQQAAPTSHERTRAAVKLQVVTSIQRAVLLQIDVDYGTNGGNCKLQ